MDVYFADTGSGNADATARKCSGVPQCAPGGSACALVHRGVPRPPARLSYLTVVFFRIVVETRHNRARIVRDGSKTSFLGPRGRFRAPGRGWGCCPPKIITNIYIFIGAQTAPTLATGSGQCSGSDRPCNPFFVPRLLLASAD